MSPACTRIRENSALSLNRPNSHDGGHKQETLRKFDTESVQQLPHTVPFMELLTDSAGPL